MSDEPLSGAELRARLDGELEASSKRLGQPLHWTWHEQQTISAACRTADRLRALHVEFGAQRPDLTQATVIRVSAELRALEGALTGLLGRLSFEPDKSRPKSVRHQRAGYARWGRTGAETAGATDYGAL